MLSLMPHPLERFFGEIVHAIPERVERDIDVADIVEFFPAKLALERGERRPDAFIDAAEIVIVHAMAFCLAHRRPVEKRFRLRA